MTLAPRSSVIVRADENLPIPGAPSIAVKVRPDAASGMYRVNAAVPGEDPSSVTFLMRTPKGTWQNVGVDDSRPFTVYVPPRGRAQIAAVVTDSVGAQAASSVLSSNLKRLY